MHRLSRVETERIDAVIRETIEKLEYLALVPETPSNSLTTRMKEDGKTYFVDALQQLRYAEVNGSEDTRLLTRKVLNILRKDGQVRDKLESHLPARERDEEMRTLRDFFERLRVLAKAKLTTTVEDAQHKKAFIETVTSRMRKNEEDLSNLTSRYETIQKSRTEDNAAMGNTKRTLKGELTYLRQTAQKEASTLAKEADQLMSAAQTAHEKNMKALQDERDKLKAQYDETRESNRVKEQGLRKKKRMHQIALQNWVNKYDTDVQAKYDELCALKSKVDEENKELSTFREHFRKIDEENGRIEEEERQIEEQKKKIEMEKKRLHDAALAIQNMWRDHVNRKKFNNRKKKKKKGKKGKKGKKKKK